MLAQIDLESQLNDESENNIDKKYFFKKYLRDLLNILLPVMCFMGIFTTIIIVCFKIYKV